jgi:ParB-like chromosome segregation protein Spo0J
MIVPGERFDRTPAGVAYKPASRALDPLDVVIADGWNVRDVTTPEALEHIAAIKLSILTNGYDETKPISVRYDRVTGVSTLVDGQCRLTACRELRNEGHDIWIPAVVTEGDEAQLTAASLSGNAGKLLTQWEIGEGCRRLTRFGWSTDKIAASICKSKRYVTDAIALSNVSLDAKAMLSAGEVTTGAVLHAVKEVGPEAASESLHEAVAAQPQPSQATIPGRKPAKVKPVSRPKAASKKDQNIKTVMKAVHNLMKSIDEDDLTNEDFEDVSVNRELLLALHRAI